MYWIIMLSKTVYHKLVTKVIAIDTKTPSTSGLVTKTQDNSDKQGLKKRLNMLTKRYPTLVG